MLLHSKQPLKNQQALPVKEQSGVSKYQQKAPEAISKPEPSVRSNSRHSHSSNKPHYAYRCDDCTNKQLIDSHQAVQRKMRMDDLEHGKKIKASCEEQMLREQDHHKQKVEAFLEGREHQRLRRLAERQNEAEKAQLEKERLLAQMQDRRDLFKAEKDRKALLENHCNKRDEQLRSIRERKERQKQLDVKLAKETHNTLIDDAWRYPHREELKKHHPPDSDKNLLVIVNIILECLDIMSQNSVSTNTYITELKKQICDLQQEIVKTKKTYEEQKKEIEKLKIKFEEQDARLVVGQIAFEIQRLCVDYVLRPFNKGYGNEIYR